MRKVVLPLVYWGSVEYWKILSTSSSVLIETHEFLPKQTIRTFANILNANGVQKLSVPVNNPAQKTPVNRVTIDLIQRWQHNHLYSIISAYRSAPYFEHYQSSIEWLYTSPQRSLLEFNVKTLETVLKFLKLKKEIEFSCNYSPTVTNAEDYRGHRFFKKPLEVKFKPYYQVFSYKHPFVSNLCVLDLIFNLGPEASAYLLNPNF